MYIITINTCNKSQSTSEIIACTPQVVLTLASILEKQKIQFKVSDRNGYLKQGQLQTNGYSFWLIEGQVFDPQFSA